MAVDLVSCKPLRSPPVRTCAQRRSVSVCSSSPCSNGGTCASSLSTRQRIHYTGFQNEVVVNRAYVDTGSRFIAHPINNYANGPRVESTSNSTNAGDAPFYSFWQPNTSGGDGMLAPDGGVVGVRTFASLSTSNVFAMADTDGLFRLAIGPFDLSAIVNATVTVSVFFAQGTWDPSDTLQLSVLETDAERVIQSFNGLSISSNNLGGRWTDFSIPVASQLVEVYFTVDTSAPDELLLVDNFTISGVPSTIACTCAPGYTGSFCQTDINECQSSPCQNGGSCVQSSPASFSCNCAAGYTGTLCETDIAECDSMPCQNGGTCSEPAPGSFSCACLVGYTGAVCQTVIDVCESSPCHNSATCTLVAPNTFICTCAAGFTGELCDSDIDECESSPCQSGGTCVNAGSPDLFTCSCPQGFTGTLCQIDIDECTSFPCHNGGTCYQPTVAAFLCACAVGFTGDVCETNINECQSWPCQNGATCVEDATPNLFSCSCTAGFSGTLCELDIDECASNPCQNGGTCSEPSVAQFSCACPAGFTGTTCGDDVNECLSSPCQNGATCTNEGSPNLFSCACPPGFSGTLCDVDVDECASGPCENGGTCSQGNAPAQFTCVCTDMFTGVVCESRLPACMSSPCENSATCSENVPAEITVSSLTFELEPAQSLATSVFYDRGPQGVAHALRNNGANLPVVASTSLTLAGGQTGFSAMWFPTNRVVGMSDGSVTGVVSNSGNQFYVISDTDGRLVFETAEVDTQSLSNVRIEWRFSFAAASWDPSDWVAIHVVTDLGNTTFVNLAGAAIQNSIYYNTWAQVDQTVGAAAWVKLVVEVSSSQTDEALYLDDVFVYGTTPEYACTCSAGYTGVQCETVTNPCAVAPCSNGGSCTSLGGTNYMCSCPAEYTGTNCESRIPICTRSTPCMNGATCIVTNLALDQFLCACSSGFTGPRCQTALNFCRLRPCLNGGTCTSTTPGVTVCSCPPGFTGRRCETDINECLSSPCMNWGACRNLPGTYSCTCRAAYTGARCETFVGECQPNTCGGAGACAPDNMPPGQTVGQSTFQYESATVYPAIYRDRVTSLTAHALGNVVGEPTVVSTAATGSAGELTWTASWTPTVRSNGMVDGAVLGVQQWNGNTAFFFSDTDGRVELSFSGVDVSNFIEARVSVRLYFFSGTWDSSDSIHVFALNEANQRTTIYSANGQQMMAQGRQGKWNTLAGFVTGSTIRVNVHIVTTERDEVVALDDVIVSGIPRGFTCHCAPGYSGANCDVDVSDDCSSENPCQNGATCNSGPGTYTSCTCEPGYTGSECEDLFFCDARRRRTSNFATAPAINTFLQSATTPVAIGQQLRYVVTLESADITFAADVELQVVETGSGDEVSISSTNVLVDYCGKFSYEIFLPAQSVLGATPALTLEVVANVASVETVVFRAALDAVTVVYPSDL
jgi:hypothetical protein